MLWFQRTFRLPPQPRGMHLLTAELTRAMPELSRVEIGLWHLFLQHTSAALVINENADSDVARDLEDAFDRLAPEDFPYRHDCEGPDDMPAHIKSCLQSSFLSIPVAQGRPLLGTWQGIFLCEHRDRASGRSVVMTLSGSQRTTA